MIIVYGGIMKKLVFGIFASLTLTSGALIISKAQSGSGCDSPKPGFDGLYCIMQDFVQADNELNIYYKQLRGKLNPQGRDLLKKYELVWIDYRDEQSREYLAGEPVVKMWTATRITKERTEFLKARLRECNSTGCVNSKLK
jgi:uncharacterized protein YecT (DUF1311 family)